MSICFQFTISGVEQLNEIASDILMEFSDKRVFFLKGNLGAGKTSLIQYVCKHLGIKEKVVSPSFAIINIYRSEVHQIYHIDLYRLNKTEEAIDLGIEEYLYSGDYCFIEWPEMIEGIYSSPLVNIDIDILENKERLITITEK